MMSLGAMPEIITYTVQHQEISAKTDHATQGKKQKKRRASSISNKKLTNYQDIIVYLHLEKTST